MNIEQFRTEIISNIESRDLNISIKECDAIKNNGVKLCGVCIGAKGTVIYPSIYLENYYEKYVDGVGIEQITDELLETADKAQYKGEFNPGFYEDFEKVRDCLRVKIINTEKNRELLKETPNREFLDLSIVVYCSLERVFGTEASILVKNSHIKKWGITCEELLNTAYENTKKDNVIIKDLADVISGLKRRIDCENDNAKEIDTSLGDCSIDEIIDDEGLIYVMSFARPYYGAVCMIFDDLLDEFLKEHSGGVYILPSSIHEVILIPESENEIFDEKGLSKLVDMVNKDCLSEEEILADHAYYYSTDEGYLFV